VTLTLKHNEQGLTGEVERLYSAFKTLRKNPFWKKTQTGGIAFLEIKRSRDRQSWHPHFHIVTQGKRIDSRKLSALWKKITTDSFIVDVRPVRDDVEVVRYITKYASKPFDPTLFESQPVLQEAILALAGRRMAITYGDWKGLKMTTKPDADAWDFLDTLEGIAQRALAGDSKAYAILHAVCGQRTAQVMAYQAARHPPPQPRSIITLPMDQLDLIDMAPPRRTTY
jgi:hypothetical protein